MSRQDDIYDAARRGEEYGRQNGGREPMSPGTKNLLWMVLAIAVAIAMAFLMVRFFGL